MRKTTSRGLPTNFTYNTDQHGNVTIRFRKGSVSAYTDARFGTEKFEIWRQSCLDKVAPKGKGKITTIGSQNTKRGSFSELIAHYKSSYRYQSNKESTKKAHSGIYEGLRKKYGDLPINEVTPVIIRKIIEKKALKYPYAASNLLKRLKSIFDYAEEMGMLKNNPARAVKFHPPPSQGFHVWTQSEIDQFIDKHPKGTQAYLALTLMRTLTMRMGDVSKLTWQNIQDDQLVYKQGKTGTLLSIEILPELAEALKLHPRDNVVLLTTMYGRAFSQKGFGNWFKDSNLRHSA